MNGHSVKSAIIPAQFPFSRYDYDMNIYPSHRYALAIWRDWSKRHPISLSEFHQSGKRRGVSIPAQLLPSSSSIKTCASTKDEIARALSGLPSESVATLTQCAAASGRKSSIEILVGKKPGVKSSPAVSRHQCVRHMPRKAFLEVFPGVWVSSPELVYAQMAARMTYGELLALGYELCGSYPVEGKGGFLVRRPLTTPERLLSFLSQLPDMRSVKLARSAAAQVRRKSASVMETEIAIATLTSRRRGGLGLPDAQLNAPFVLSEKGRRVARQQSIVGDLCWWERRVVVEYDGRDSHSGDSAHVRDSRRRDALLVEGVSVTTVTASQFASVYEFAELMGEVSKKVGKRFRGWATGQIERHMELRSQVRKFHREAEFCATNSAK